MEPAADARGVARRRRALRVDALLVFGAAGFVAGVAAMVVIARPANIPWYAGTAVTLACAAVVRLRRPDHRLTAWFAVFAAVAPWGYVTDDLLAWSGGAAPSGWVPTIVVLVRNGLIAVNVVAGVRLFVRFPDGVTRDSIERRVVRFVDAIQVAAWLMLFTGPAVLIPSWIEHEPVDNPFQVPGFSVDGPTVEAIVGVSYASVLLGLVLLVRRYRRSDPADRKRIRWLLLPLIAAGLTLVADLVVDSGHVAPLAGIVATAALSVGIAFGIVNPDGVDIDDVLRRTIVWGAVWFAIAAAYAGLSALFGVTVGQRWSVGWAVTMTVVAMVALQPVRGVLERIANRRLFGPRPDPTRAIVRLGDSLAETYDLDALLPDIEAALEEGLGVEWARVRLTPTNTSDDREPALAVPITTDGEEVGRIECGPRLNGHLGPDDEAIVATFARRAALAVRNVRLTAQLRQRTADLAASRNRLVRAEEAERRRIERNIHDGVQQDLVALIGHAGLIRKHLRGSRDARDSHDAQDALVDDVEQLVQGLQRLLAELRELAAGIHPSVLRDRGLLAAVETLAARNPVPVRVRADSELRGLRLPAEVEGAGYYMVAESLANSLKHADARHIDVTLARENGSVAVSVRDDGCGFDPGRRGGNGLTNLTERVAAVDGTLTVASKPGRGTTVAAVIPISEPAT